MDFDCKVIQLSDVDALLEFEEQRLKDLYPDAEERMFQSWHSRGRKESIEHYAKLGWSFKVCNEQGRVQGYILAQPFLFVAGHTQSLWVEHLHASSLQARDLLTETVYKLSREKHLQGVYYPNTQSVQNSISSFKPLSWTENPLFVPTVKR